MSATFYSYTPSEGHGLPHDPFNAIIAPRPIGWISTVNSRGQPNLAPYSFFNGFNYTPPILGFASVSLKDTVRNVQATGEFVWNLCTVDLAEAMNQTCAAVAPEVNEFELAGLESAVSETVKPPRVAKAAVAMECVATQVFPLKDRHGAQTSAWMVLGEVVRVHIRQDMLVNGIYNTATAGHLTRGGGPADYFTMNEAQKLQMWRPR